MEFVNLTPHEIVLYADVNVIYDAKTNTYYLDGEGVIKERIPASGTLARCKITERNDDGIFIESEFSDISGIPEPKENTVYIVSAMVKNAVKDRKDVVVTTRMVKTKDRKIILGCLRFSK